MTAEEILKKQTNAEDRPITKYLSSDGFIWKMILKAMEEYAEQQVEKERKDIIKILRG
jgi:hypothetical protein